MKTVNGKSIVSILTMFGLLSFFLLFLPLVPAMAANFEIGTQFGISHLMSEIDSGSSSVTILRVPSGEIGTVPASPYLTWFPNKQYAIRPEFGFTMLRLSSSYTFLGETTDIDSTTKSLYLGGRFEFYLSSHEVSSPYGLIRGSMTTTFFDSDTNPTTLRFGVGGGYQWRIRNNYILRAEGQYLRAFAEDEEGENVNGFTFIIGIGIRFGSN